MRTLFVMPGEIPDQVRDDDDIMPGLILRSNSSIERKMAGWKPAIFLTR